MFVIPDDFAREIVAMHEEEGRDWLGRLPAILTRCEQRWGLRIGAPFANLSFNYVAPAVRTDGTAVIVKAYAGDEFPLQVEALRLFDGHGMVQFLECEVEDAVLLMEYLQPGTTLLRVEDDEQATAIAASVMRQVWRPVSAGHPFPTVFDWGRGFERLRKHFGGGSGPFPPRLLEEAETLFAELAASMAEPMLLHGDLHHDNILMARRQPWLAIDPKGLVGEPAYETGALLRNALARVFSASQPRRVLARRVDQLAEELELDRVRVRDWGLAQGVLSVWWGIEDSGYVSDETMAFSALMAEIKV